MEVHRMLPSPSPSPPPDFNFESTNSTPYATAPSTPHRFPNFFYTAPTSPTHLFPLSPTLPPFKNPTFEEDQDFAFDFRGHLEPPSISPADDLFHCGKIKPSKHISNNSNPLDHFTSALKQTPGDQSPSTRGRKDTTQTSTTTRDKPSNDPNPLDDFHNFTLALKQTPGEQNPPTRGRKKTSTIARDKLSRSSPPFRISDILSDEEEDIHSNSRNNSSSLTWYNKWNLKNLLLFRSASEGSARRKKDPVNRYARIRKIDEKSSSRDVVGSSSDSCRRVMRKVSAHEMHYMANRAVAEEMRKKTFLPYKSGLLGCLGFHNHCSSVEISRGISSVMKQR